MADFTERLVRDLENGELRDGAARYLLVRADTLMGLFLRLPSGAREAALDAFRDSTIENGARSARAYQEALPADERARLLDVIAATAPHLGWGRWRFLDITAGGFRLEVANSPFAAGFGAATHAVCHPIAGMLIASGTLALGRAVRAVETSCGAVTGDDLCRFEVTAAP